jgi:hypothetical protein
MLMEWPEPKEYDQALLQRATTFSDPAIKTGKLVEDGTGPIRLNGSGKYVCVYRVDNWVIRCFTQKPPADLVERYRAIIPYLNLYSGDLSCLVPHQWVEGVRVNNQIFPYVKVPFIHGSQTLGDFLAENYRDRQAVKMVADLYSGMMNQLEARQTAHGDLDITNILVCGQYPHLLLKLIDYDGMYVPTLPPAMTALADLGHANFQPVRPGIRKFGPEMDRFSSLIIYLSLVAIADDPTLWEACGANDTDRLLLGVDDFERLGLSPNFQRLYQKQTNSTLQKCLYELSNSIAQERMPGPLKDVLRGPDTDRPLQAPARHAIPLPVSIPSASTPDSSVSSQSPATGPTSSPPYPSPPPIPVQLVPPAPGKPVPTRWSPTIRFFIATALAVLLVYSVLAGTHGSAFGTIIAGVVVCVYLIYLFTGLKS